MLRKRHIILIINEILKVKAQVSAFTAPLSHEVNNGLFPALVHTAFVYASILNPNCRVFLPTVTPKHQFDEKMRISEEISD